MRKILAAAGALDGALARPLLTGKPGQERRDGAVVDLAQYDLDPEYRAMIDARQVSS
jgi:hypothetical protein